MCLLLQHAAVLAQQVGQAAFFAPQDLHPSKEWETGQWCDGVQPYGRHR
jgi:hypothetical protein